MIGVFDMLFGLDLADLLLLQLVVLATVGCLIVVCFLLVVLG